MLSLTSSSLPTMADQPRSLYQATLIDGTLKTVQAPTLRGVIAQITASTAFTAAFPNYEAGFLTIARQTWSETTRELRPTSELVVPRTNTASPKAAGGPCCQPNRWPCIGYRCSRTTTSPSASSTSSSAKASGSMFSWDNYIVAVVLGFTSTASTSTPV